jgi:uncharacterized damage-inducible protein DinB
MKQHLLEMFAFNHTANEKMIEDIKTMDEKTKPIQFISHLINSQNKWLARIQVYPKAPDLDWWEPVYVYAQLTHELAKSNQAWTDFLEEKSEDALEEEVHFIGYDGSPWTAKLKDIALQLIFHSFHHRAQIQTLIREEGKEPRFVDYIGGKYRKIQ